MRQSHLMFLIIITPLILYHTHTSTAAISYFPTITDIDFSDSALKYSAMLVMSIVILGYIKAHSLMPIIAGVFILITISFANPIIHYLVEINKNEYNSIKLLVDKQPDLINILPNYVNTNCEMTDDNYKSFNVLATTTNSSKIIESLPIHKKADQVKMMCAHKIFNNQFSRESQVT